MKRFLLAIFVLLHGALLGQSVVINEAMSSNASIFSDEDGNFSDWIEFYNATAQPVSLNNFGLSDDPSNLQKWKFPPVEIQPNKFLVVYASGKDRKASSLFWETLITKGDTWKYFVPTFEPSAAWRNTGFNDAAWNSGASGFGYGDNDDATIVSQTSLSVYVRKTFTIVNPADVDTAFLHVDYDDGFVAYLNGVEIARANVGTIGVPPAFNQTAAGNHEANMYQGGNPDAFSISNIQSLLKVGENVLAMQVHNVNSSSSDLTLIPFLTLGFKTAPTNPRGLSSFIKLPTSNLHTNFKLNASGDQIILSDSLGNIVDQVTLGFLQSGYSFGRKPDGTGTWFYFSTPTPLAANTSAGLTQAIEPPQFSKAAGFYPTSTTVQINSGFTGGTIYFTLDGSEPVQTGTKYTGAISITKTTTVRAKVFATGAIPSPTTTATFFINHVSALPVISLSTDPKNFFDNAYGIYAMGSNPGGYPYFGANFWQDWERPIHFEFFEPADTAVVSVDAGVKINGNWSRAFDQKSMCLYLRGAYGFKKMQYKFFSGKNLESFENIILRNGGNDFQYALIRDRYVSEMVMPLGIGAQQTRFCATYLNGNYWGMYTLRERIDENFLKNTFDADAKNVELIEITNESQLQQSKDYFSLHTFINNNSLASSVNYAYVNSQMDVENFMTYQIAELFIGNSDWPGNNIKVWKEKTTGGKWRWVIFDVDYGVGLAQYIFSQQDYKFNSLDFATATDGPSWPNPPWATLFLRKFLENTEFKNDFIQSFAHLLNTRFSPDSANVLLNKIHDEVAAEVPRHLSKWTNSMYDSWETNITKIRDYVTNRYLYARAFINSRFQLGGLANVTLMVNDTTGGTVSIQSFPVNHSSFTAKYFKNCPIRLTAKPNPGYVFAGWKDVSQNSVINVTLAADTILQAVFLKDNVENQSVVINEINYKSATDFDPGDWVEIYNNSKDAIDLTGWTMKDDNDSHIFSIPSVTLNPDAFLVLVTDSTKFKTLFPEVTTFAGNFSFGLSSTGETVRIYNQNQTLVDSVTFSSSAPWVAEPDGTGATLALINPVRDNTLAENWKASLAHGTPGKINDIFSGTEESNWNKIPKSFALNQNFPNPFNPSTIISYQLAAPGLVTLKLFDVLGKEVATLIHEEKPAGKYQFLFTTGTPQSGIASFASGVYFYQLRAGSFVQTRKMIILK